MPTCSRPKETTSRSGSGSSGIRAVTRLVRSRVKIVDLFVRLCLKVVVQDATAIEKIESKYRSLAPMMDGRMRRWADRRPHTNREPRVYYGHERRDLAKRQASDPRASATSCAPVNIPCLTTVRPLRARLRSRPHTARDGSGLGALAHVDRGRAEG
jgi:hypothetical protein